MGKITLKGQTFQGGLWVDGSDDFAATGTAGTGNVGPLFPGAGVVFVFPFRCSIAAEETDRAGLGEFFIAPVEE